MFRIRPLTYFGRIEDKKMQAEAERIDLLRTPVAVLHVSDPYASMRPNAKLGYELRLGMLQELGLADPEDDEGILNTSDSIGEGDYKLVGDCMEMGLKVKTFPAFSIPTLLWKSFASWIEWYTEENPSITLLAMRVLYFLLSSFDAIPIPYSSLIRGSAEYAFDRACPGTIRIQSKFMSLFEKYLDSSIRYIQILSATEIDGAQAVVLTITENPKLCPWIPELSEAAANGELPSCASNILLHVLHEATSIQQ